MRTTVSLPDLLFEEADELAQKLGISRNELYVRALVAFLRTRDRSGVTQALDRVYTEEDSSLDPPLVRLQGAALSPGDW